MEEVAILAGFAFAINKTVSLVKALTNRDSRTALTQMVVWVVGFFALLLAATSDLMGELSLPGFEHILEDLDVASLALLSWILGSTGSFAYDFKKAIDNTDDAREAPLSLGSPGRGASH